MCALLAAWWLLLSCSPVPIILGVVTFLVLGFVAVNVCLYYYAQQVSMRCGAQL
jgi:hypothetical protein